MVFAVVLATILSTTLGGLFALRFRDKLHLILGFSAGAVIGVAFFDLIPESIRLTGGSYDIKLVTLMMAAGFAFMLLADRFFSIHPHEAEECCHPEHQSWLAATALVAHSCLDGLGIGLAFKVSPQIGWIVAAAVLAHDFSDGINTVNIILSDKAKSHQAWRWLILDALAPAVGLIATLFFAVSARDLGLLLAVFCGFFLYIGASDLIPESHHKHPTMLTTGMTLLGMVVMYLIISIAG